MGGGNRGVGVGGQGCLDPSRRADVSAVGYWSFSRKCSELGDGEAGAAGEYGNTVSSMNRTHMEKVSIVMNHSWRHFQSASY